MASNVSINLPKGWIETKINYISELIGGGTPSRKNLEYFDGNIVWLTPTEISKHKITKISNSREQITKLGLQKSSAKLIPKDTVLLTSRASIGYVAIAGTQVTTNQGFASFVCNDSTFNYYLAYWLWGNRVLLEENATGTIFKEIPKSKLKELKMPLPPLNEQKRIVTKIESIFAQIDAAKAQLEALVSQTMSTSVNLNMLKSSVLKQAFEGKLVQQNPNDESAEILLRRIHESSKDPIFEKENLPKGWIKTRIGIISSKIHYGYTAKSTKEEIGPKYLRITDIQNNSVNWKDVPCCKIPSDKLSSFILKPNDLLFARTGATVGKSFLINNPPSSVFASYLIRIILDDKINVNYVNQFFKSDLYWKQIRSGHMGTAQPNFNASKLSKLAIPLPPLNEQKRIVSKIESIFGNIDSIEKQVNDAIRSLNTLKQSVLKQAFEGKLVPQDPNDEPASVLLEKIQLQKK